MAISTVRAGNICIAIHCLFHIVMTFYLKCFNFFCQCPWWWTWWRFDDNLPTGVGIQGRGVDNTLAGWTTDYLLSLFLLLLAALLRARRKSSFAVATHLAMGSGYFFGALGHHLFPSRAMDSPCADRMFYIVWALSYISQGLSCIFQVLWADKVLGWEKSRTPCLLSCIFSALTTGSVALSSWWCVLFAIQHQCANDRFSVCDGEQPSCDFIAFHFEMLFYFAWGFAWLLVTFRVYRVLSSSSSSSSVVLNKEYKGWALHVANVWASVALFAYGPMLILWVVFYTLATDLSPEEGTVIYAKYNIGIIYHSGVLCCHLCTYYVSKNIEEMIEEERTQQLGHQRRGISNSYCRDKEKRKWI